MDSPPGSEPVAVFEIRRRVILAPDGEPVAPLPEFAREPDSLRRLYRAMVETRIFDERAVALQRAGQLGTYASSLGQEAVAVGVGSAMVEGDVLVPSFREHGTQLLRGVSPLEILLFWGGDERGCDFAGPRGDFPVCIPVASQAPHAVGVGLALQLRGGARAAVCVLGDGATSKGDFYEALNLAGVWSLPVVFVVSNNGWAISVPRSAQTAACTLAQKGVAAGVPGEQLDGNDVIVVRAAMDEALARARAGRGPTLLEALTYRLADHTTSDDASRYRDEAEVREARGREPLLRLRRYLEGVSAWSAEEESRLRSECEDRAQAAAEAYLAVPAQPAEAIFDHLHAELPAALRGQRRALLERVGGDG